MAISGNGLRRRPEKNCLMRSRIIGAWLCAVACCLLWPKLTAASEVRETPLVRAIKRVQMSVVDIHSEKTSHADREGLLHTAAPRKINGMGTGIIIDERGYI